MTAATTPVLGGVRARQAWRSCPTSRSARGDAARAEGAVDEVARRHGASADPGRVAWLLARSPAMLPIPGTSSVGHLEENVAAAALRLEDDELEALSKA